jgi:hypothetical protein
MKNRKKQKPMMSPLEFLLLLMALVYGPVMAKSNKARKLHINKIRRVGPKQSGKI